MNWSTANPPRVSSVPIDSWSFNSWRARYCRSSAAEEEEEDCHQEMKRGRKRWEMPNHLQPVAFRPSRMLFSFEGLAAW